VTPFLAPLLLAALAQDPQILVFEARVSTVYVDVFVTRDGEPVKGLTSASFTVTDDGVRQQAALVDLAHLPVDILLVLDVSGSLRGARLESLRRAARAVLASLGPTDRAGLLVFSDDVRLAVPHTSDVAALDAALESLEAGGTTSLNDALFATVVLARGRGRGVAIVFSDGKDSTSWLSEEEVLDAAERSNVLVHGVGILPMAGTALEAREARERPHAPELRFLYRLTGSTGGSLWLASSTEGLAATFQRVIEALHNRYVLRFTPTSSRPGRHELDVRLVGVDADVRARPSYFVSDEDSVPAAPPIEGAAVTK
jgi:Ca-activated chloride channel homolog